MTDFSRYSPGRLVRLLALGAFALVACGLLSALFGGVPLKLGSGGALEKPVGLDDLVEQVIFEVIFG